MAGGGLRERKKQRTHEAIVAAAFDLFATHGFDPVTVASVARRAEVSEATVFNYFPTKEDLVFGRLEQFELGLVTAVRERPAGQSVIDAFGAALLAQHGLLGSLRPADAARLAEVNRIIAGSAALRARERQVYDDYERRLARALAAQSNARPGDIRPAVVAASLIGLHRALVEYVRGEVLAGRGGAGLVRRVRNRAEQALSLLDHGLSRY
jgi:AcrR family transcriptional regulator